MANPTSNFGWQMPQNTDLVKDLPADFEVFGQAVDTSLMDLKGGTTGQVLSKASNTDMDFTWVAQDDSNAIQNAIVDAKGDLISATAADTPARLAVGTNGQVLTADSTQSTGLKWATPASATTWTQRLQTQGHTFTKIEYNGSNLYVAVGSSGNLYSSADAITWTARTSGFGAQTIQDVAFGNGLWVAVGNNGLLSTSTDGTTWTARTANMSTEAINAVAYANSLWVAVGGGGGTTNSGGITYSTDGLTWTRKSQSITVGADYYSVVWNGTNWIVGASSSTNNYLYASTPSGTWTAAATGTANDVKRIFWDGTRHTLIVGTSNIAYYTTSTTMASVQGAIYAFPRAANTRQGSWYFYDSKIYVQNSRFWQTVTPASSLNVTLSAPQILPNYLDSTTPFLSNFNGAIWAGAAGIIAGGESGIWTSF
jgi:hypothetical protein